MSRALRMPGLLLIALGLVPGCGGVTRYDVSGKVTFNGAPLPAGVLYFDPDIVKKNDGPQGFAIIKDGAYSTATLGGKGTVGGPHIARIEGFDGKEGNDLPLGRLLFSDFQKEVELPKSSSTTLDFDIKR
jgi:hypothetical protein